MKEPTTDELHALAAKWINNTISDEEKKIFIKWYDFDHENPILWEGEDRTENELESRLLSDIYAKIKVTVKLNQRIMIIAAAAVLCVFIGVTLMFVKNYGDSGKFQNPQTVVRPGINNAILTLANGKQIDLTRFKSGTITDQTGSKISKDAAGQLKYDALSKAITNYTISTPIGTEYNLKLPDGSYVWLNSGSSITFPNYFKAGQERRIELIGEAYFEIKKDKKSPFKVITKSQGITVVGTHFNVDSYGDQSYTKTTLLEGSIIVNPTLKNKLSSSIVLKPGQQLTLTERMQEVKEADTAQAVGWKNGRFIFHQEEFEIAVSKISKWYNVTFVYKNLKPINFKPWASISRQNSLSEVLKILESTNQVHFKIEGRAIIVTN